MRMKITIELDVFMDDGEEWPEPGSMKETEILASVREGIVNCIEQGENNGFNHPLSGSLTVLVPQVGHPRLHRLEGTP